jgi:hypothetical protein
MNERTDAVQKAGTIDQPSASTSTTTAMESMTAIVQDAYGTEPEDVLRLAAVARPSIRDDEVRVLVHAASVDRGTWHVMAGLPYPVRAAGFGLRRPKHLNPGRSLSGTVDAVGTGVSGFEPGDEVFGIGAGSFAEYVSVRTGTLAARPSTLSFDEAAAVPVSALTALQAVRDHGRVQAGDEVLIIGASGGVAASPCRSPRRSARRSPACAAPQGRSRSGAPVRTTSSTTPVRTSPTARTATTSSSTPLATAGCPVSGAPSLPRDGS